MENVLQPTDGRIVGLAPGEAERHAERIVSRTQSETGRSATPDTEQILVRFDWCGLPA